ncbi:MAG: dihydropteroate synthase [Bacteroidota bacterium]|nr:dihydropteroate synthase [Bacteroidota bacterium]
MPKSINVKGKLIELSSPKVMGIINITPDSFYEGSRFMREEEYLNAALKMVEEGAAIIDIGGYSTRPGASKISPEEERDRVLKAIKLINRELPDLIISIDTFRADIAMEAVLECGAGIINDITGGEADKKMFRVVEKLNVPYVLMHMKGTPGKMERNPVYDDVVADILRWLSGRITRLQSHGVNDIIIDPGFGFGKTVSHNFEMLRRLRDFSIAGLPVLVGISRKSMIWKSLDIRPEEAQNGTTVLNTAALLNGADILRVHDVREAVQAIRLVGMLRKSS